MSANFRALTLPGWAVRAHENAHPVTHHGQRCGQWIHVTDDGTATLRHVTDAPTGACWWNAERGAWNPLGFTDEAHGHWLPLTTERLPAPWPTLPTWERPR